MPQPQTLKRSDRFLGSLIAITLSEIQGRKVPQEVQVLKIGTYFDARYGQFEITKEMLLAMKRNFDKKVMKIDPAFDFKHDSDDIAAGWFQQVDLRNDNTELWVKTDWTPEGEKKLADREFRYISADFTLNYIDNETLVEFGPTLRGAALTNRPVIKGMAPVTLTEGEGQMDEKDKQIAMLTQKVSDLEKKLEAAGKTEPDGDEGAKGEKMMALKKQIDDLSKENEDSKKKLAEYADKEAKAEADKKMAEKKAKFDKLLSEGKAVKAQEEAFLKGDMEKFFELGEKPNLEGNGNAGGGSDGRSVEDQVIELAEKKVTEKKAADMASAISLVLSENPNLAKTFKR